MKVVCYIICLFLCLSIHAQNQDSISPIDTSSVFTIVEKMPRFPGGDTEMYRFIATKVRIPWRGIDECVQGKVYTSFVIDYNGAVRDIEIKRGLHYAFDAEAERVISKLPKWTPGMQKNQPVNVKFMIPITFDNGCKLKAKKNNVSDTLTPSEDYNYKKGVYMLQESEYGLASKYLTKTIDKFPDFKDAIYNRALAYIRDGNTSKACEDFLSASKLGDNESVELYVEHCQTDSSEIRFNPVEKMPLFPGGDNELMRFIATNTRYPSLPRNKGIQGKVFVQFIIDTDGSVIEEKVVKSVHPELDEEALRVVRSFPKWIPGESKGQRVKVQFTVPIFFKLEDNTKKKKRR